MPPFITALVTVLSISPKIEITVKVLLSEVINRSTPLLPLIIPAIWVITGSTILRVKETKGCKSFYVYTITQIVYYSMDKYLTKLLKL